jgi:hypothetical protein
MEPDGPQQDKADSDGHSRGLPCADAAIVEKRKITDYLLDPNSPDGAGKAWFFAHFGFVREDWQVLAEALRTHGRAQTLSRTVESTHGTRYTVIGPLETPCGRRPIVATIWIADKGTAPRLVTAYPAEATGNDTGT